MNTQEMLETYLASPRHDEAEIRRGFDPDAGPDIFAAGLQAQMERHQQQLMRQHLARLGAAVVLSAVRTTVALLNATAPSDQDARDAIYQNAFEFVGECGRAGIGPLLTAAADPDPEVRALGAVLLGCHEGPTPEMVDAVAPLLADDDLLARWAAASAIVLWDDDGDPERWATALVVLTEFAMRAMHLLPDAVPTLAQAARETSRNYANATLFLRLLPMLLGTRG